MEWLNVLGTVVLGLALRFAVPIGGTILLVLWLRWLDARWQQEAEAKGYESLGQAISEVAAVKCWEIMGCPPERREHCAAYLNGKHPCWHLFRGPRGELKEECLGCKVFREAPVPVIS